MMFVVLIVAILVGWGIIAITPNASVAFCIIVLEFAVVAFIEYMIYSLSNYQI